MCIKYDTVGFIGLKTKYVFSKVSFGKVRQPYKQTFSIPAHLTPVSCNSGMSQISSSTRAAVETAGAMERGFFLGTERRRERKEGNFTKTGLILILIHNLYYSLYLPSSVSVGFPSDSSSCFGLGAIACEI